MENPIKTDDLGVPVSTPILGTPQVSLQLRIPSYTKAKQIWFSFSMDQAIALFAFTVHCSVTLILFVFFWAHGSSLQNAGNLEVS